MVTGYLQTEIRGEKVYIKADRVGKLREVGAVIFDCDGVLIDIRDSYNAAISETVTYLLEELTGASFPQDLVSREIIYLFKRSGGFNNDWDLAYAILAFILCELPGDFQEAFKKQVDANQFEKDPFRRFLSVKKGVRKEYNADSLDDVTVGLGLSLRQLAETSDASGVVSVEEKLAGPQNAPASVGEFYAAVKRLLSYPGGVGESLLVAVFEEIFCGPRLFKEVYKLEPRIHQERGLIENERVILRPEALDQLASLLGEANFGVASGRLSKLAEHTLKGLLRRFNPKALVFLDDTDAAEREAWRSRGTAVNLRKPNPFSLLEASKGLKPFKVALYVGDSMEDVLLVKEANKVDSRFMFAGVYEHSDCKGDVLRDFLGAGVEAVVPSVNELPTVLKALKEEGP